MAESYSKIFPGNAVNHVASYALPNPDFAAAGRAAGAPQDRKHQALMFAPGWQAVRKVGFVKIDETVGTEYDVTIPSPDTRSDDKVRADIKGLHIPQNAICYRAGFRVLPLNAQPGYYSQGARAALSTSGIVGTNTDKVVLASAAPASSAAASIGATAITTATNGSAVIVADGVVPVVEQKVQTAFGAPVVITQSGGLTLKLYSANSLVNAAGSGLSSTFLGGVYVVCEACYLVQEELADAEAVFLPGARYSGFSA